MHATAFSQHDLPELCKTFSLEEGAGNAGCALHPRSRVQNCTKKNAHEHTGSAETLRHSPRNGFTAYAVLSPATNSSCHRRCRLDGTSDPVGSRTPPTAWHQQRVSGPHGFAVRISAVRPARRYRSRETRPATSLRADASASTASPPAFVTTRDRPSCRERTGRAGSADLPDGECGILPVALFCRSHGASGWTKVHGPCPKRTTPVPRLRPDRTCRRDVKLDAIDPKQTLAWRSRALTSANQQICP
jgi:hypothetical protein